MNKGTYVEIHVGERLKKYIEECYSRRGELVDGMVVPKKGSSVYDILRPYLELHPRDDDPGFLPEETVRIWLPFERCHKVHNHLTGKVYYCDTFWRNWLTEQGHAKMRRLFDNNFRFFLYAHLDGYTSGQREVNAECRAKVKKGLYEFCDNFHFTPTHRDEMKLLRAYYRYLDNREECRMSPFFF